MAFDIIKRDGTKKPFEAQKIINAVLAAFKSEEGEITDYARTKAQNIATYIQQLCEQRSYEVEEIQDLVEKGLMSTKSKNVAKSYILYRENRTRERERRSQWYQDFLKKMRAEGVENFNANVDERSAGGRIGEADAILQVKLALENLISPRFAENHKENRVYIHDLRSYLSGIHNCLVLPIDKLLAEGVTTKQQDLRPAGSLDSACQLTAVYIQMQSLSQFGGCSVGHLDWTMVPYIRKSFYKHFCDGLEFIAEEPTAKEKFNKSLPIDDEQYKKYPKVYKYAQKMLEKEAHQACESLFHNLNSLQVRSSNQLAFSSCNFGTCTLPEGRVFIKAYLDELYKGGGPLYSTYIFPCGVFTLKKGVNRMPSDPNYDLFLQALKCTAKRLYPNYANGDWSENKLADESDVNQLQVTMGS